MTDAERKFIEDEERQAVLAHLKRLAETFASDRTILEYAAATISRGDHKPKWPSTT